MGPKSGNTEGTEKTTLDDMKNITLTMYKGIGKSRKWTDRNPESRK